MNGSILWINKTADELRTERDLAIAYLELISQPDPERGFINRRALADEALERLSSASNPEGRKGEGE